MVLGLKCGVTVLVDHDPEWEINAAETIKRLWNILGSAAKDIQHIGSSSIHHIKAKPVIDIAISAWNFEDVLMLQPNLEKAGFIFCGYEGKEERQPVFQCGEYIAKEKKMHILTHYIHIVIADSQQWYNYINFRDYMNTFPAVALEYEVLKLQLAKKNKYDYNSYNQCKRNYIAEIIKTANHWDNLRRNPD